MKFSSKYLIVYLFYFLVSISVGNCQTTEAKLKLLEKHNGRTLLGHYTNPEDSHYVHKLKISFNLDGNVCSISKEVKELNFEMETTIFWNPQLQKLSFQTLTNKGQLNLGTVSVESDRLIFIGESIEEGTNRRFKQSFYFISNNGIEDRFFLLINGEWKERHLIIYN